MKRTILVLSLLALFCNVGYTTPNIITYSDSRTYNIPNGWYKATVTYFNANTYTKSTYTLNVKVEYNYVTVIDFGNGGSVHSGYNNSGYTYSGGYLSFKRSYSTNEIESASTSVTILEGTSRTTFEINL